MANIRSGGRRFPMHRSLHALTAVLTIALLFSSRQAMAQCFAQAIDPGNTATIAAASSGSSTPINVTDTILEVGYDSPTQNTLQAVSESDIGGLGLDSASANAELDYTFCIPGSDNASLAGATIAVQIEWHGLLFSASASVFSSTAPVATGTVTLFDDGPTDSSAAPEIIASSPVFSTSATGATVPVKSISVNLVGQQESGSTTVPLNATLIVGHTYTIRYKLDCESPTKVLGVTGDVGCDFGSSLVAAYASNSGASTFASVNSDLSGNYYSSVDLLRITVPVDTVSLISSVSSQVEALAAQVKANQEQIVENRVNAEQENAHVLGILNSIQSAVSKLAPQPPVKTVSQRRVSSICPRPNGTQRKP